MPLQTVMVRRADRWIARIEWVLPVRGRWARYLTGALLLVLLGFFLFVR